MKAIICTKYGPPDVLQIAEIIKPVPKDDELCIRVIATAITASDCIVRGFHLPKWHPMGLMMGFALGFNKPRNPILGMITAGVVESVGKNVSRYTPGDEVFSFHISRFGSYAQAICMPEKEIIAMKPNGLSFEEAAAGECWHCIFCGK